MSRKKLTIKINPGQACVVADITYLRHIVELYKALAADITDPEDKKAWLIVADTMVDWIDKTYVPFEDEKE